MKAKKIIAFATASALTFSAVTAVSADISSDTCLFGDVNADGSVNGNDVLSYIRYFLELNEDKSTAYEISYLNADIDRDGELKLTDLATLKQYTVGDKVSMGGRIVEATSMRTEDRQLITIDKKTKQCILPSQNGFGGVFDTLVYAATDYDDALLRLSEINCDDDKIGMEFFDTVNFKGSPCYDSSKGDEVAIIFPLNNSSIIDNHINSFVNPDAVNYTLGDGDLWACRDINGFNITDREGSANGAVVYAVKKEVFQKIAGDMGILYTTGYITGYRNGEQIRSIIAPAKPVIYLYPEEETDVHVELDYDGELTCTYPKYTKDGWNVTAQPDGTLTDKEGYEYSYLYWEGKGDDICDMSEGFVVKGEDTASFLREKLSYMGLTPKEYNEFIVYWLPLMENNPYNLISFQSDNYTETAKLSITPEPDSMQRVFMAYQSLDEYVDVPEQTLPTFERKGFSVVEWGGTEVK